MEKINDNGTSTSNNDQCFSIIDRKQYEDDLQRRQKEHLDNVYKRQNQNWCPCMHDACPECLGTGIKHDGSLCIHFISCPCPKCSPT